MQGDQPRRLHDVYRAGYDRGGAPSRAVVLALALTCLTSAVAYLVVFLAWTPPHATMFGALGVLCVPAYLIATIAAWRGRLVASAVTSITTTLVCLVPFALTFSVTSGVQLIFLAAGFMTLVVVPERQVKTRLALCGAVVMAIIVCEFVASPSTAAVEVDDPVFVVVSAVIRLSGIAIVLTALTLILLRTARAEAALTALARAEEQRANTDLLTGIANRRPAMDALADLDREPARGACLALVDIDRFKTINDDGGHALGDAVIAQVAARLDAALAPTCLVARWGGDEFLVLSRDSGLTVADALDAVREDLAAHPLEAGGSDVTLSVGIAYRAPGESTSSLLQAADAALYLAKSEGRNRVTAAPPRRGG